ncbi:MAG: hypothetical protein ACI8RZ_002742 [Myxococcota bacterium]|jgi:hypothetical protein
MSALLLSLAIPALSHAEPRTPACSVFAEAEAWDWPAQSTCGKLLGSPEPAETAEDGAAVEADVCPISCRLLNPVPVAVDSKDPEARPPPQTCGPDVTLCIAPRANPTSKEKELDLSLFRKPDQEETAPPTPPPVSSHKPGLTHVFDQVKALNTCRTQTAAGIPRPEKPRKNEFEGSGSFSGRQQAYTDCQNERETEVIARQSLLEPIIEEMTFFAILRADDIGSYDADEGCFFPGVTARVELDDFKSKDAVYLNHYASNTAATPISDPKRRLIPRDSELRVKLTSETIASVTLDPDSDRTVLLLSSHPVCVDAATGREYREQLELNGISDFGIQAEMTLQFRFEVSPDPTNPRENVAWPTWVVDGDFVYRNDPAGSILKVEPGRKAPIDSESAANGIDFSGGDDGCGLLNSSRAGMFLGLFGLLGFRRRR